MELPPVTATPDTGYSFVEERTGVMMRVHQTTEYDSDESLRISILTVKFIQVRWASDWRWKLSFSPLLSMLFRKMATNLTVDW